MKLKNLPAGKYAKISTTYISLLDGNGCTCDNCGRLIANMVTVEHEGNKRYTIGQDCAKTLFDEKTNKEIDIAIKGEKKRQERERKAKESFDKSARLKHFLKLKRAAGITNENCNTDWAKSKHNEILDELEEKYGCYITYRV